MTKKWLIEYFDDPDWIALDSHFKENPDELNGHEEASFSIPNTEDNRTLVSANKTCRVKYDGNVIYTGLLSSYDIEQTRINCVLYNACYELMKAKTYTATHMTTAADEIMALVCAAAGVTLGECPETELSVRFDEAYCYDIGLFVADVCGKDYWTVGTQFNIGDKGSLKTLADFKVKGRGIDRSRKRTKVRVKGTNSGGVAIVGEAGVGTDVAVYREKKVSDTASLTLLAEKYLADLNTESQGAPLSAPISLCYDFHSGDSVAVDKPVFQLTGTFRIKKITKARVRATIELDRAKQTVDKILDDQRKNYEDIGIYQLGGGTEPTTLSYQNLELFYYLDDGIGVFANDYSPTWRQGICVNTAWVDTEISKALYFDGYRGYASCGNDMDLGGKDRLTVATWLTPGENFNVLSSEAPVIHKPGNFTLSYNSDLEAVTMLLWLGAVATTVTSTEGSVPVDERTHVLVRYNGSVVTIYVNGEANASVEITGAFSSSFYTMFLGAGGDSTNVGHYKGSLTNVMVYSRDVFDNEVLDIFNYSKLSVKPILPANFIDTQGLQAHYHLNEGYGDVVNDSTYNQATGDITNAYWDVLSGSGLRFLAFGGHGYVDCGEDLDFGTQTELSIGCWATLTAGQNDANYLIYKADQFFIQHYGTDNRVRFGVWIDEVLQTVTTEANLAPLGERLFIMGTWSGGVLRIYINGTERARTYVTAAEIASAASTLYLGAKGVTET